MFEGFALTTFKLHLATRHLFDMARSQGPLALTLELWIERMIHYMKHSVRNRVRQLPEVIFFNDHLLFDAADRAAFAHPSHCSNIADMAGKARDMCEPEYDVTDEAVFLLGRRSVRGLSNHEADLVLQQLPRQLRDDSSWYGDQGWPAASQQVLADMFAEGSLQLDKFMKARISGAEHMTCAQDFSQPTADDRWALISFAVGERIQHCIAQVQFFVRATVAAHGMPVFAPQNVPPSALPTDKDGNMLEAQPLRMAVCKLWRADICQAGTVGCIHEVDAMTGELPDLFVVSNMSEASENVCSDKRTTGAAKYYGEYLCDISELTAQMVPTVLLREGGNPVRYFMTAFKASGHG